MDANKRLKLIEIGYEIGPTCETCRFGEFVPYSSFGSCFKHYYEHEKHTEKTRPLSVHMAGHCPDFELDHLDRMMLATWEEFFDKALKR